MRLNENDFEGNNGSSRNPDGRRNGSSSHGRNGVPDGMMTARRSPAFLGPRDVMRAFRENWKYGFAAALVAGAAVAYFQLNRPEVYEATATLMFQPSTDRFVDIREVVDTSIEGGGSEARLRTHLEQIRSSAFLQYVSDSFTPEERQQLTAAYADPDYPERPPPHLGRVIRGGLDTRLQRGTYVLAISMRHRDPEAAATIANRYATKFIEFNLDRATSGTRAAVVFLQEQAEDLRKRVEKSEDLLQDYRRRHQLVALEENQNIVLQRLTSLSNAFTRARVERLELESMLQHIDAHAENRGSLLEIAFIAGYGSIASFRAELDRLGAERALLQERYLEEHPRMRENQRALQTYEELLATNIATAVADLRNQHHRALQHEQMVLAEYRTAESESIGLDADAVEFRMLRRQVDTDFAAYSQILDRLNETIIAAQLENINIRSIDTAGTPYQPVEPNVNTVAAQAILAALVLLFAVPIGLGAADNRIKGPREIEDYLQQPLLGEIPALRRIPKKDRAHVVARNKADTACEAFRGLFSQLELTSEVPGPKILLLTSTSPSEGKSVICNNLAATFAAHGRKTLLLDCDFRRPALHRFHASDNESGVLRWLRSDPQAEEHLLNDPLLGIKPVAANLDLLRAGGDSRKPTEFFHLAAFRRLFHECRSHYDLVVVDSPPAGFFPDALLLSRLCDEIIFLCQFNRVDKVRARNLLRKFAAAPAPVAGIVINGVPAGRKSASYELYGYGSVESKDYRAYYAVRS